MNFLVVGISGLIFGWGITLYTIIAIYVSGRAVDMVYTNQNKLTITIVTEKYEELTDALIHLHARGVTVTDAEGAYTHKPKKVLTTVITKYELNETKHAIRTVDPEGFCEHYADDGSDGSFPQGLIEGLMPMELNFYG